MNDKQILDYVKNMIKANLNQYIDIGDTNLIVSEIYDLENDEDNKVLLGHIKGIKALLERAEQITEKNNK